MKKVITLGLFSLAVLAHTSATKAAGPTSTATVNFKGTLVYPIPCTFASNSIEIDFQDMVTTEVDGTKYRKPINLGIDCSQAGKNELKMRFAGTADSDNNDALGTNVDGFAIQFARDSSNTTLPLNGWFNFDKAVVPTLSAVPVKAAAKTLAPATISATATLEIEYQ
jgi:type 1 fimbria pilin